jgi:peptide/nickel transport system permease protein
MARRLALGAAPYGARRPWAGLPALGRSLPRPLRRFLRHRPAVLASMVIVLYLLAAALAPELAPRDPLDMSAGPRLYPPNPVHWFGTDEYGRDIYTRVLYGARIALTVGLSASLAACVIGSAIGLVGGYFGGLVDRVASMLVDLVFAFPTILLAIALAVFMNPSMQTVIVAIAIVQSPHFARVIRGAVLAARQQPYVESAILVGAGHGRIVRHHILPNVVSPVIVQVALSLSYAVLSESALSFLGVGNPPPAPSWGAMLSGSYGYVERAPWAAIFPGLAITLFILAFNMLGDGLQDLLDPTRR